MREDFRPPTEPERRLLAAMVARDFPGAPALREQLASVSVKTKAENEFLEIRVETGKKAKVKERVPVLAEVEDVDGVTIHILLHVVRGLLYLLELYKDDPSQVSTWPNVDNLRLEWIENADAFRELTELRGDNIHN